MSDKQKRIMEAIEKALPKMSEAKQHELLGIVEGAAMMVEQRESA